MVTSETLLRIAAWAAKEF